MYLTIITVNYNNLEGLKKTFESVFNQNEQELEYIVIDGGSTDGSKELIEEHKNKISYWVSEPDTGIYNAMNKGIKKASGDYLLFLNSGDWLVDNHSLPTFMDNVDNYDIVYGDWYLHFSDCRMVEDKFPDVVSFYFLAYQYSLPHQASIIRREFLIDHGMYDESLRMVSDWKFFLEAIFKWDCKYLHKPIFLCCYDKQGFSSNSSNDYIQKSERETVLNKSFKNLSYIKTEFENFQVKVLRFERNFFIRVLKFIKLA